MNKYELTTNTKIVLGRKLFQIRALASFGNVKAGELGGYIESENNLTQNGNAWVRDDACVCGDAQVCGNACVCGNARVYGNAQVYGNAYVYGNACVCGNARVSGNSDYLTVGPIGSRDATTTFYRRKDGVTMVVCGCFYNTIEAFETRVKEVYGDDKHGKAYQAAIALARVQVNTEPVED